MDHDRLFKELLSVFFFDFVDLFLPDVSAYIDKDFGFHPMNSELLNDERPGAIRSVDLLMRVKFRGEETCFLIHVENQASARSDFPKRMFDYFTRLLEIHQLPVYPVALFSYDQPLRREPNQFTVDFPDRTVLQFTYAVIQLNRMPWRHYVNIENPVATALMAKMQIAPRDRPKVRLQCLRVLATLRLDPARSNLIGAFIENYRNYLGIPCFDG
jgi:hypothetical protein